MKKLISFSVFFLIFPALIFTGSNLQAAKKKGLKPNPLSQPATPSARLNAESRPESQPKLPTEPSPKAPSRPNEPTQPGTYITTPPTGSPQ